MKDPRRAAVAALMRAEQGAYANLVLNKVLNEFDGTPRDRAFCTAIFYGTVERLVTIDHLLGLFVNRPLAGLDREVRAILRCGLYQARWMDSVPVSAAVNESVVLTRDMGKGSACGMVNAVLRRAAAVDLARPHWPNEPARLSVQYSVSPAIARMLYKAYPIACEDILRTTLAPPPLCVRVNTLKTDARSLAAAFRRQGITAREAEAPNSLYLKDPGDVTRLDLFREGAFHVQGAASQLACAALAVKPGETVLDLCAAPGGKSALLAQEMQNTGTLISRDLSQNRLPLIESALRRLDITCARVEQGDATVFDASLEGADAVLCDVPCSGLGVMAKKPDIRLKSLATLPSLIETQRAILETASRYVRPGGRLVYSTCTLNPDENAGVVRAFLSRHTEFSAKRPSNAPKGAVVEGGLMTLLPHRTGMDGFFIAILTKQ